MTINLILIGIIFYLLFINNKLKKNTDDGFEKFLIKSRNDAFIYIEQTQEVLKKFINEVDRDIKYFEEFGDFMAVKPNYEAMQRIANAYKELKTLLPEEENN